MADCHAQDHQHVADRRHAQGCGLFVARLKNKAGEYKALLLKLPYVLPQMAFLALVYSQYLRTNQKQNSGYGAQLFNYAAYQINYILGDSGRRCGNAWFISL